MKNILCFLIIPLLAGCSQPDEKQGANWPDGRWIDLTYSFGEETIYWPTSDKFALDTVSEGMTEKVIITPLMLFRAPNTEGRIWMRRSILQRVNGRSIRFRSRNSTDRLS